MATKVVVRIALTLLALGVTAASAAEHASTGARSGSLPVPERLLTSLASDEDAKLLANVLTSSHLTSADFRSEYVTILVPSDKDCWGLERARLGRVSSMDAARAYVFDHTFDGSLAVLHDDRFKDGRILRVNYFPHNGSMNGRVTIDESHPFEMPLRSGNSVRISLAQGVLYVGSARIVSETFGALDGEWVYVDQCALF